MLARLRKTIAASMYGGVLPQDLSMDERRTLWPAAQQLRPEHVRNCRVVASREEMLSLLAPGAVCAEVGIWLCEFSTEILARAEPQTLHLIDIDERWLDIARSKFPAEITSGRVVLHSGDSSAVLASMPRDQFDWVYIDGDHTYEGCQRDIEAALTCLKPSGLLVFNDYIFWGPSDFCKYGVMEAVNECCLTHGFEFVYFALQGRGYYDVAIRRIA